MDEAAQDKDWWGWTTLPSPLSEWFRWSWLDEEPKIRVHVQTPPNWPDVGVF